ncbi:hypothetical protein LBMAG27_03330 [Bacteroidota bacterium]|nr:hypothetical protein LBMAG27_03330 [Bacteroidota bacterium]
MYLSQEFLKENSIFYTMNKKLGLLFTILLLAETLVAQTRAIVNASFEIPAFSVGTVEFLGAQNDPMPSIPGWYSTNGPYGGLQHPMEIWSSGYSGVNAAPGLGNQYNEINCSENARIYQIICLVQGEKIDWSFYHRGRAGIDVTEFNVYDLTGSNKIQVFETATSTQDWKTYTGSSVFTGPTGFYQVSFEAMSSANDNPAVGNFLDGVNIAFHPMVEFIQPNYSGVEHVGNNLPRIRLKGTVPEGGMNLTFAIAGGTATPGIDFNLNTTLLIPEGEYSGSNSVAFTLPLTIYDDELLEQDETVVVSIIGADAGGQLLDANCDGQSLLTSTYKIVNDDICVTPYIISSSPIPFCAGDTILLHVGDVSNVEWSTGEKSLAIAVSEPGKYVVTSFDHNCNSKDSILIETKVCDCNVVVPTAFSPNGDGMNDLFRPLNANQCKVEDLELKVFNRWGDLIYTSTNIQNPWDGTYKGEPAPTGVYLWTLEYKIQGEKEVQPILGAMTGNVTLLR